MFKHEAYHLTTPQQHIEDVIKQLHDCSTCSTCIVHGEEFSKAVKNELEKLINLTQRR